MIRKNNNPFFKINAIIRHKLTGKPMLVIKMFDYSCLVVDIEIKGPQTPLILLERDFPDWTDELKLSFKPQPRQNTEEREYRWTTA